MRSAPARSPTLRRVFGEVFSGLTGVAILLLVAILFVIVADALRGGWGQLSWAFLTTAPSEGMTAGGVFPAIWGTAVLTLLMTVAVMPVGVMTAVYLSEYAPQGSRLAAMVRAAVQNLAGVPSVVFGLFGLGFFVRFVGERIDRTFGGELQSSE